MIADTCLEIHVEQWSTILTSSCCISKLFPIAILLLSSFNGVNNFSREIGED